MSTVHPAVARRYRLRATGRRPLTSNERQRMHKLAYGQHVRATRQLWWGLAVDEGIPTLDRIRVTVTPLHRDRRSPQDVAACQPEAKAAIDGLVDAHVIPDDNPDHLLEVVFRPPDICGENGMALYIEEIL